MEKEAEILDGVAVEADGLNITVKGPKGEMNRDFTDPRHNHLVEIVIETVKEGQAVKVRSRNEGRRARRITGTIASHINNMITGVSKGYKYEMKVVYVHFPIKVEASDKEVKISNFFGERGVRRARIVGDTRVKADKESVVIEGISKEDVGQTASNIEAACRVTKRDRRVFQDGIYITERGTAD